MAVRSERTLREIIRVIAGRFLGMLVVFLLVVAAAIFVTLRAPKWYESETQLLAKPKISGPVEMKGALKDEVVLYISTLRSLISSDHVLASTLLRLEKDRPADAATPPGLPASDTDEAVAAWQSSFAAWNKDVKGYIAENTEEISKLRDRLSVVTPGGPDATFTQTLRVQVRWPEEREKAARLGKNSQEMAANTAKALAENIVDAYEERAAELEWNRSTAAAKFLTDKSLASAQKARMAADTAYEKFITEQTQEDLVDMQHMAGRGGGFGTGKASLATTYAGEMTRLDESIAGLQSMKSALQTQMDLDDDDAIAVPDSIMMANQSVMALEKKILSLKLHINSLTPRYTEDYKELTTARAELVSARKEFRTELKKQMTRTQQDLDSLTAKREKINSSILAERKRLKELAMLLPLWKRLEADKEAAQTTYNNEVERINEANTAKLSNVAILLTTLSDASQPDATKPVKPIMLLNVALAIAGGFLLSLIYAFSADHFDHTFKGVDDAEKYLGVPVLASIPKLGRRMIRAKRGV